MLKAETEAIILEFGSKLKDARVKKGLSQQELADQLFVARQTVSRWENGSRYPDYDTLGRLSEILGVSASELLGQNEIHNMTITAANDRRSPKILIIALVALALSAAIPIVSVIGYLINAKHPGNSETDPGNAYIKYDEYARHVYRISPYCGFFVYEDENAEMESSFHNGFTITLLADGQFTYYETMISSYIGHGHYTSFEDGKIILETDDGKFRNTFLYSAEDDTLTFVADGSTNFTYKKLADGTVFRRSVDRSEGFFFYVE